MFKYCVRLNAKRIALTLKKRPKVSTMQVRILPISEQVGGTLFDTTVTTPEMLNSSVSKVYPFGNIKIPVVVISAVNDPLSVP